MNYTVKLSVLFTLLFVISGIMAQGTNASLKFDKAAYYSALSSGSVADVNSVLANLEKNTIPEKKAYEGALLMKKAGLLSKAKDKLSLFKLGRTKLEAAIKNEQGNIEYHFLRLIIQENAPKIVKYQHDLENDMELVRSSFKKLTPVVQQAVSNYSKKSRFLKPADF